MILSVAYAILFFFVFQSYVKGFKQAILKRSKVDIIGYTCATIVLSVVGLIGFLASLVLIHHGVWLL